MARHISDLIVDRRGQGSGRLGAALMKYPPLWRRVRMAVDAFYRAALAPFGPRRRPGEARESAPLVARTDALNRAAERYFTTFENQAFLLNKPFSDAEVFPRHLFCLGVVLTAIGVRPTDVVLEFGAGTCWVSHFLNRYGCKTISVDVSQTALDLGRETFQRDPATRWSASPEFVVYDGHRLPLPDASCDKIVVFDAFHHVPNQREILAEMHRVLKPYGVAGMSEPGLGHAAAERSRREVETYGVLENELVIEDVAALAKSCGFAEASVIASSPDALWELPAEDLGAFLGGKDFVRYWDHQANALLASHYIVLHKSDPRPTTRRPKALRAEIAVRPAETIRAAAGAPIRVSVALKNSTETRWLAEEGEGWTRLGVHLFKSRSPRILVDYDWARIALPRSMSQSEGATLEIELPAIAAPGDYDLVFDLVIEGVAWFETRGSAPAVLQVVVASR